MSVERGGGNMHRKYIRKIFLGEIHPADSCKFENEEYEKRQTEFTKLYREIQALLPDDKKKMLELLCDAHTAMQTEIVIDGFCNGFKLGANLIAESLYSSDK